MRRLKQGRYPLMAQMQDAASAMADDPNWPAGSPTPAEAQALADDFAAALTELMQMESNLRGQRALVDEYFDKSKAMLRRVDNITSAIYGESGAGKIAYGLRPIDRNPNSLGPLPQVIKLRLTDGLAAGSIQAAWKAVRRATYEVHWFGSEAMDQLLGAAATTTSDLLIPGLAPGTQIWVRVRALRAGKYGDWSERATRIANV